MTDLNGFQELSIVSRYKEEVRKLPLLHSDPVDQMLVAQAIVEGTVLVKPDRKLAEYPVGALRV